MGIHDCVDMLIMHARGLALRSAALGLLETTLIRILPVPRPVTDMFLCWMQLLVVSMLYESSCCLLRGERMAAVLGWDRRLSLVYIDRVGG